MSAILFAAFALSSDKYVFSCKYNSVDNVKIAEGFDAEADAWVEFEDSYDRIGWGQIHIWTNEQSDSYAQMYCAGYADAYSTQSRMWEAFTLYREAMLFDDSTETWPEGKEWPIQWQNWINENIKFMRDMTKDPADDYWKRTALILAQVDGMIAGYNARAPADQKLREIDFWMLQSAGDLEDITEVLPVESLRKDREFKLHCTGLIKLAPNYEDLWFAQNTWSDMRDLHAYLKEYTLNIPEFKAHRVTISTRTGHLGSIDDYWTNDKGLLVMETTMANYNETLYKLHVKPQCVLTWVRSYHATFATETGKEWTEHFIKYNSGTYNNEYIVVDMNKFVPGEKPTSDLVWMIEQFPGIYMSRDMTSHLVERTFLQSINTPFFEELFKITEYPRMQAENPQKAAFYSYHEQLRNLIIERDAPNLKDYQSFKVFMRYNNYKNDPLQVIPTSGEKEPAEAILSRYDLRPENGTIYGKKRPFGGLDAKTVSVVSFDKEKTRTWDTILSPKWEDGIDAFDFGKWNISHTGIAQVWTYDWTTFSSVDHCTVFAPKGDKEACMNIPGCGFCIYSQECMAGNKEGPSDYFNYKCEAGWSVKVVTPSWAVPLIVSVCTIVVLFLAVIFGFHFWMKSQQSRLEYEQV